MVTKQEHSRAEDQIVGAVLGNRSALDNVAYAILRLAQAVEKLRDDKGM